MAITTLTSGPASATTISWPGLLRHALERRDASNRQNCHGRCGNPVATGSDDMAEFVKDDADEQQQYEHYTLDRRIDPALSVICDRDEGEQQEKGNVDSDGSAADPESS